MICPFCHAMTATELFYGTPCCSICKTYLEINKSLSKLHKKIDDEIKLIEDNIVPASKR